MYGASDEAPVKGVGRRQVAKRGSIALAILLLDEVHFTANSAAGAVLL